MKPFNVYIGLDRDFGGVAAEVCAESLRRTSSIPLDIQFLDLGWLRRIGLYARPFHRHGEQLYDSIDGRPFSTEFSFSRFLVPLLQPSGWAMFCDSDFLFMQDVAELTLKLNPARAAYCVQHAHAPQDERKMLGQKQTLYYRKNWSSLVVYNCSHPANQVLTPQLVNTMPGSWLHAFQWIVDDAYLGALPMKWNWLDGHDQVTQQMPGAVHFTRGTPDMPGYENTHYAPQWLALRDEIFPPKDKDKWQSQATAA